MKNVMAVALLLLFASPVMAADFTFTVTDAHVEDFCTANGCNDDGQRPLLADKQKFYKETLVHRMKIDVRKYYRDQGAETGADAAETTNQAKIDGVSERK